MFMTDYLGAVGSRQQAVRRYQRPRKEAVCWFEESWVEE